ncbi:P-loop containing nucleoside triphosphate hydrolase protein [Acaromyces ingoldii]|uniref:P-loop containing nucleoside triphosphate hydrolase protein n=1 Tax=Acaromyces ingoldii TaxID=215250 RepID=A0A316YWS4_9BASI|nr:P-loop containing nucleoside triphosphate hydrolase protein [Acaromyces ingoldii]PWN93631.1 P-loop containing nucleoside triphosphate hydrolase protein [Acaromyces ingoldii]
MAPRKKNASIKSTGATSSKASPLPDWVKGKGEKPAAPTYYTKAQQPQPPSKGKGKDKAGVESPASGGAATATTATAASSAKPPQVMLFPPGTKTPLALLNERIQKHHQAAGWLRPQIDVRKLPRAKSNEQSSDAVKADNEVEKEKAGDEGGDESEEKWTFVVTLTKTNKSDASHPFIVRMDARDPSGHEGSAVALPSKEHARHWGATYALFRLCSTLSLYRVLPSGPREYWQELAQHKQQAPKHLAWLWADDPFEVAQKMQAEKEAKREAKAKQAELEAKGEYVNAPGRPLSKAWQEAVEVRMASSLRHAVEKTVREAFEAYPEAEDDEDEEGDTEEFSSAPASGTSTPSRGNGQAESSGGSQASEELTKRLTALGFRKGHARSAARWVASARKGRTQGSVGLSISHLSDEEAGLEYLVLYCPEDDLPKAFAPSKKADSFVTSSASAGQEESLALRWAEERLVKLAGFPRQAVSEALTLAQCVEMDAREALAIDILLRRLACSDPSANVDDLLKNLAAPDGEIETKRADERMALDAVLGPEKVIETPPSDRHLSSSQRPREEAFDIIIASAEEKSRQAEDVRLRVCPGRTSLYPIESSASIRRIPTFYIASKTLPAYLRLALTRRLVRCLSDADAGCPDWVDMVDAGQGGVLLAMVEDLETNWQSIVDDPPDLAEVMAGLTPRAPIKEKEKREIRAANIEAKAKASGPSRPKELKRDAGTDQRLRQRQEELWTSREYAPFKASRATLPAHANKEALLQLLEANRAVIIAGETGCGKTTQCPQFILDDAIAKGKGSECSIVVTQPRRISAMGVATRVAAERCENIDQARGMVGYAIRGERKASKDCRLLFSTTGVLLRRLGAGGDSDLKSISHVIVDEVHERGVDSDLLLLELREVLKRNPTIKVVLMSATINHETFSKYFGGAPCLEIPGRTFPVRDHYLEDVVKLSGYRPSTSRPGGRGNGKEKRSEALRNDLEEQGLDEDQVRSIEMLSQDDGVDYDLVGATVKMICARARQEEDSQTLTGAILVFCSGVGEIRQAMDSIRNATQGSEKVDLLPLHANLSAEEQRRVFVRAKAGWRKVVVATNVAETSITIDDVAYVVDLGRVKETRFDANRGLTRLVECWASRAACKQRRGRAGRVRAGECFKLFTRHVEKHNMSAQQAPEMTRVPLESLLLQVKVMRGPDQDVGQYLSGALDPPSIASIQQAFYTLVDAGAIRSDQGLSSRLTALGRHLSLLPLDLRLGKMFILGSMFGCLGPMLSVAAVLSCKPLFSSPFEKRQEASAARLKLANINGPAPASDLLVDAKAYEMWASMRLQRAANSEIRAFCEEHFLSMSSLRDVHSTRFDLLTSLQELGFVSRSYNPASYLFKDQPHSLDAHASSTGLARSLIVAGLWPNMVRIANPKAKFDQSSSGTVQRQHEAKEVRFFEKDSSGSSAGHRVFLHPASSLFANAKFDSGYLAVYSKGSSGKAGGGTEEKVLCRDATEAPLFAILLFGGKVKVHALKGGISVVLNSRDEEGQEEGWIKLRANARIAVLCRHLRRLLDQAMDDAFERPQEAQDAFTSGPAAQVCDAMRALLQRDGRDPNG